MVVGARCQPFMDLRPAISGGTSHESYDFNLMARQTGIFPFLHFLTPELKDRTVDVVVPD
jgi:hypothetical protein